MPRGVGDIYNMEPCITEQDVTNVAISVARSLVGVPQRWFYDDTILQYVGKKGELVFDARDASNIKVRAMDGVAAYGFEVHGVFLEQGATITPPTISSIVNGSVLTLMGSTFHAVVESGPAEVHVASHWTLYSDIARTTILHTSNRDTVNLLSYPIPNDTVLPDGSIYYDVIYEGDSGATVRSGVGAVTNGTPTRQTSHSTANQTQQSTLVPGGDVNTDIYVDYTDQTQWLTGAQAVTENTTDTVRHTTETVNTSVSMGHQTWYLGQVNQTGLGRMTSQSTTSGGGYRSTSFTTQMPYYRVRKYAYISETSAVNYGTIVEERTGLIAEEAWRLYSAWNALDGFGATLNAPGQSDAPFRNGDTPYNGGTYQNIVSRNTAIPVVNTNTTWATVVQTATRVSATMHKPTQWVSQRQTSVGRNTDVEITTQWNTGGSEQTSANTTKQRVTTRVTQESAGNRVTTYDTSAVTQYATDI